MQPESTELADTELTGVAALADRPADGRRVARVMAIVAVVMALLCGLGVEHMLASANEEPEGGPALRRFPVQGAVRARSSRRLALVLIDGMRVDEARALGSLRALAREAVVGELALTPPTLSRPFYHLLFTGVPATASGVRTNRFVARARHDSVMDRVRAAGGSVTFIAEALEWMRRMHGRPGDAGSDSQASIDPSELDAHLLAWRDAPAPALLVVHVTSGDHSAHEAGIHSSEHRRALERADRVIARVAEEQTALVVLSDHGHIERGGHGGPEPEVVRAPLLVRESALAPATLEAPIDSIRMAATLSALLGVPSPTTALGTPVAELARARASPAEHSRLASIAGQAERASRLRLTERRRWSVPLAMLLAIMALGTIKRAYGFDRSVVVALLAWPAALAGLHLALGRPLSLSGIDTPSGHGVRIALLGLASALVAFGLARLLARRGGPLARTRRAAASAGLSALSCALLASAWSGFALGPWPLSPLGTYLPLLTLGAAAPALVLLACIFYGSIVADRSAPP